MATFNFVSWQPLPVPAIFDGLPYPLIFFHQNDRKGCSLDYLDGLGHFLFGFWATEKILEKGWLCCRCQPIPMSGHVRESDTKNKQTNKQTTQQTNKQTNEQTKKKERTNEQKQKHNYRQLPGLHQRQQD